MLGFFTNLTNKYIGIIKKLIYAAVCINVHANKISIAIAKLNIEMPLIFKNLKLLLCNNTNTAYIDRITEIVCLLELMNNKP